MGARKGTARIAVLDHDESFRELLQSLLAPAGHSVKGYATPGALLDDLARSAPDLVVLDLAIPHFDGWEVLAMLRGHAKTKKVPIVIVTGRHKKARDVVKGLGLGADDYFTKPPEAEVFVARVESLLRRYAWQKDDDRPGAVRLGPLMLFPDEYAARLGTKDLELSRTEFEFLLYLVEHPNRVHTRPALIENVWKEGGSLQGRTIDKYVETLRRKLGPLGTRLETIVGVGYLLRAP